SKQDEDVSASRFEDNEELRYSLRSVEKHAPWVRHIFIVTNGQIPSWLNLDNPRVTVASAGPDPEELVDRCGSSEVVLGELGGRHTAIKAVPIPGWQTSSVIRPATCSPVALMSATVAKVCLKIIDIISTYLVLVSLLLVILCKKNTNYVCLSEHFGELHHVTLLRNQSLYTLPLGETRPYFSFGKVARRVSEAHVRDNSVVRHTSVANKWKTIHLLLYPGHNATQVQYNITFQREDDTQFTMSFSVAVDTREVPQTNASRGGSKEAEEESKLTPSPEPVVPFLDIPEEKRGPKIQKNQPAESQVLVEVPLVNVSVLPPIVQNELKRLEEKLLIGDITMKGYNLTKAEILKPYRSPSEKHQDMNVQPGNVQGRAYKDLEEDGGAGGNKMKKKQNSHEKMRREPMKNTPTPSLILPHIDNKIKNLLNPERHPLNPVIERPEMSKLHNNISQKRSEEIPAEAPLGVGRKLQHFTSSDRGFLPWERRKYFQALLEEEERLQREFSYRTDGAATGRKLQDTFAESLRYVNKLLNGQFGFTSRKVPAHMPHMIDRLVMQELQDTFPEEFDKTSGHRVRHSEDMQFAFSYFYFLMSAQQQLNVSEVFDEVDTDHSGVLSDREIRTLATRIHELPLSLQDLTGLEQMLINCSKTLPTNLTHLHLVSPTQEAYYDPNMEEIAFKMVRTNVSHVVGQLDDIRKNPSLSFPESTATGSCIWKSSRTGALTTSNMSFSRRVYRDKLKFWTHCVLVTLVVFTVMSFFAEQVSIHLGSPHADTHNICSITSLFP
ncbi:hypothetical protein GOODEAATRI_012411, partial [Goodea atripinnis]